MKKKEKYDLDKKNPMEMLLSYQIPHANQLIKAFGEKNCVLDASDTGTGKTYTALACCYSLKLKPFIICPKSVINTWIETAKKMDIEILGVSNYEKLKSCYYYTSDYKDKKCPYVKKTGDKSEIFHFSFPDDTIIIVDEAHKCKNYRTINCKMLFGLHKSGKKILLISATICDTVECFRPFGIVFDLYNEINKFKFWIRSKIIITVARNAFDDPLFELKKIKYNDAKLILKIIHDTIFPNRGSRMKIKDLGDLFPKNQIIAKCYYSDDHEKVDELYTSINIALENLKNKEKSSFALGEITRCRMRIEMIKLPIILDLIDDALENGFSVVVFVNYKDSMHYLAHHSKEECSLIHGNQSIEERQFNIDNFQSNKTKIIIGIIQAGGIGISLHDLHGRPRMSLISPTWSASDMVQAFGRIHRAGSLSPALQRIVYIANSYEEEICNAIGEKLSVLSSINDGDLIGPDIQTERLKENGILDQINKNVIIHDKNLNDSDKPQKIKTINKKKFDVVDSDENNVENNFKAKGRDIYLDDGVGHAIMNEKYKLKKK